MTIVQLIGSLGNQMLQCASWAPNACEDLATESAVVEARARQLTITIRRLCTASSADMRPAGWIAL